MNGKQLYTQLKLGQINKNQLTDNEKGELYKFMVESNKISSNEVKPEIVKKYNLAETPKNVTPSTYTPSRSPDTNVPINTPTPRGNIVPDIGTKSTNPELELVDVLSNLSSPRSKAQPYVRQPMNDDITLLDRIKSGVSSIGKTTLGSGMSALGTNIERFSNPWELTPDYQKDIQKFTTENTGMKPFIDYNKELEQSRQKRSEQLQKAQELGIPNTLDIMQQSDRLLQSAAEDNQRGKQGLGKGGQIAYDILQGAGQMGADIGIGIATGTGLLPVIGVRSMGSGASEARQAGADINDQVAYGTLSAGIELATEKIVGGLPFAEKLGASGIADNTINKLASGIARSPRLAKALTYIGNMAGEGAEEMISEILSPVAQRLTYDPNADWATIEEVLYSGLMGAGVSGIMGGGVFLQGNPIVETLDTELNTIYQAIDNGTPATEQDLNKTVEFLQGLEQQYPDLQEYLQGHIEKVDRYKEQLGSFTNKPLEQPTTNEIQTVDTLVDDNANVPQNSSNDLTGDITDNTLQESNEDVTEVQEVQDQFADVDNMVDEPIKEIEMPTADYFMEEQEEVQENNNSNVDIEENIEQPTEDFPQGRKRIKSIVGDYGENLKGGGYTGWDVHENTIKSFDSKEKLIEHFNDKDVLADIYFNAYVPPISDGMFPQKQVSREQSEKIADVFNENFNQNIRDFIIERSNGSLDYDIFNDGNQEATAQAITEPTTNETIPNEQIAKEDTNVAQTEDKGIQEDLKTDVVEETTTETEITGPEVEGTVKAEDTPTEFKPTQEQINKLKSMNKKAKIERVMHNNVGELVVYSELKSGKKTAGFIKVNGVGSSNSKLNPDNFIDIENWEGLLAEIEQNTTTETNIENETKEEQIEETKEELKERVEDKQGVKLNQNETKDDVPPQFQGETPVLEGEEGYIQFAPTPITDKFMYDTPELEKQYKENRINKQSKISKFRELASEFKKAATRTYRELDPKDSENAEALKEFIRYPKIKSIAGDEATRILIDITQRENQELSKEEYSRFERFVFLADLMEEIKLGHQLPGLWTEESVKNNHERLKQSLTPNIEKALERRKEYWETVIEDYTKAMGDIGYNVKDRFSKQNYFRHQVLEYVNAKQLSGSGSKVKAKTNRGYNKARQGTEKAINEDYLQAEYEVLSTMLYDKEIALMLKRIDNNYGIKEELKAQAKAESELNNTELTWRDLVPDDYVVWQPIPGKHLFTANTISEKLAEAIIQDTLDTLPKDKNVRQALVLGTDKEQFVIPSRIAKTLDSIYNKSLQDDIVHKILSYPMSLWKSWVLTVNPRQVVKYNLRNITGDIDGLMAAAGVKAFNPMLVGRASKELFNAMRYGKFTKDILEFRDKGGFSDLMYAQELGEIYETKKFKNYNQADTNNLIRKAIKMMPGLNTYTDFTENATNYRESIFRYTSYLYFKEDIKKNGKPTYYGASTRERIDGLKTIEDKAYQLSKDALGSYDEITEVGQILKKYLIPFHSWNEVNMKRYKRVFENTIGDIKQQEEFGKQFMSGLKLAGYTGIHGTRLLGKMAIRVFFASALLIAWNRLARPDDDDELPDDIKNTPHLTLGRDDKGNIIYFSRLGALNDVFDWFGLDQIIPDLKEIINERKTIEEQAMDMAIAPLNKIVNSISPFIKTPIELLSNSSYYPDIRQPSTIRDTNYYIFNSLGLGEEYRRFAGLPTETSYKESWIKALVYKSNPEVNAYYKAIDLKYQFEEKVLNQQSGRMLGGSEKSEALYYYKQALKYDDEKAADKYLKKYYELGGTENGLSKSLTSLNPMYGLVDSRGEKEQFREWLTEDENKILDRAMKYYNELIKQE